MMSGTVSHEIKVNVPATEAWKLYGTLRLAKLIEQKLPSVVSKIDVVQGDGATGTILELFFPPGVEGLKSMKEKFTSVDDEKRVKETEVVEGGYLNLGFKLYRATLQMIEVEGKEEEECITRATIEYELNPDADPSAAGLVSTEPLAAIMQIAADYLHQNYKPANN